MKKVIVIFLTSIFLVSTGCIESIHPLVTKDTVHVDANLEGTWIAGEVPSEYIFDKGELYMWNNVNDSTSKSKLRELLNKPIENRVGSIFSAKIGSINIERAYNLEFLHSGKSKHKIGRLTLHMMDTPVSLKAFPLSTYKDSSHISLTNKEELPFYLLQDFTEDHDPVVGEFERVKGTKFTSFTKVGSNLFMDVSDGRSTDAMSHNLGHTFYKVELKGNKLHVFSFNKDYLKEQLKSKKLRIKHETTVNDDILITASTKEMRSFLEKYGDDQRLYEAPRVLMKVPAENIF